MQKKPLEIKIENLISGDIASLGYEVVRVHLMANSSNPLLQIMAERCDGASMTVDDCATISHAASEKLDADDSITNHYTLEVSSPGIDRPLIRLKDFERFKGHIAKIELEARSETIANGKKRFQAHIGSVSGLDADAAIELCTEAGSYQVPLKDIARAQLVLTDALLKTSSPSHPLLNHH